MTSLGMLVWTPTFKLETLLVVVVGILLVVDSILVMDPSTFRLPREHQKWTPRSCSICFLEGALGEEIEAHDEAQICKCTFD